MILGGLLGSDGRLGRSWKDRRATGQGVLEDYANLAEGLLALYEATFDERWFTTARSLADAILEPFKLTSGEFVKGRIISSCQVRHQSFHPNMRKPL